MSMRATENPDLDLWMHAELLRIQGEHWLARGDIINARKQLLKSIEKNQKEVKTWMAYSRLNETIFNEKQDEHSI